MGRPKLILERKLAPDEVEAIRKLAMLIALQTRFGAFPASVKDLENKAEKARGLWLPGYGPS